MRGGASGWKDEKKGSGDQKTGLELLKLDLKLGRKGQKWEVKRVLGIVKLVERRGTSSAPLCGRSGGFAGSLPSDWRRRRKIPSK